MKKFSFLLSGIMSLTLILLFGDAMAQLSAGDVAFTAFNADGDDDFAIVALVDIPANSTLYFTDNEPNAAGDGFADFNEGSLQWVTGGSVISAGTIVVFTDTDNDANTNFGASIGTLSATTFDVDQPNLSSSGDALYCVEGDPGTSSISAWLAGIANATNQAGANFGATGLTVGTTFINFYVTTSPDGGEYTGLRTGQATFAGYLALLGSSANWTEEVSDGEAILPISTTAFTIGGSGPLALTNVSREHLVPTSSQSCYVQGDITGGTTPYTAVIKWTLDEVAQADIPMSNTSGDTYQGTIPAQADDAIISYYVDVTDAATKANVTSTAEGFFWGNAGLEYLYTEPCLRLRDANGELVYKDYYCRVTGTANVASGVFSTTSLEVYIQGNGGGINIYKGGSTASIVKNNNYTIVGKLDQYNGKAEVIPDDDVADITNNGPAARVLPDTWSIAGYLNYPYAYEAILVSISNAVKTAGTWPGPGSNGTITVTDDGGMSSITIFIDNDTDLDDNPEPVWPSDIVGIFIQYDPSLPYDAGYQVMPRSISDIVPSGQTTTWTGGNGTADWFDALNWDICVPTPTGNAVIPAPDAGVTVWPDINTSTQVNTISIQGNASGSGSLTGVDYLWVTGADPIVQRYYTGGTTTKDDPNAVYHFISAPVKNPTAISAFPGSAYIRKWNEPTQEWINLDGGDALSFCNGYTLWLPEGAHTAVYQGDFDGWNHTVSGLTYTVGGPTPGFDGYNLVGNPYPSGLDWDVAGWVKTNIDATIAIWNGATGNYYYWNGTFGSIANGVIPMGHAFFVKASGAPALTIPFNGAVNPSGALYKNEVENLLSIKVKSESNLEDELFINFNDNATAGYDAQYDGQKMYGLAAAPQIFTKGSDGVEMAINTLPYDATKGNTMPMHVLCSEDASFTLTASDLESFNNGTSIYLEDMKTGGMINLMEQPTYSFNYTVGDDPVRFTLHFEVTFGTPDLEAQSNINMYAANHSIYLTSDEAIYGEIQVFNLMGQQISTDRISGNTASIPMASAEGQYIVRLVSEDGVFTQKVFVK